MASPTVWLIRSTSARRFDRAADAEGDEALCDEMVERVEGEKRTVPWPLASK